MKIKNKKAISHIEVIISFIIFIGFAIFLLTFLKPVRNTEISQAILDSVQRGILNEAGVEYNYTTLKTNNSHDEGFCVDFSRVEGIGVNIIIRNDTGDRIEGVLEGNELCISQNSESNFSYVYYSSEFDVPSYSPLNPTILPESNYSIGLLRKNQALSYKDLLILNDNYYDDYNNLKTKFKIPAGNDFGFVISSATGEEILRSMKNQPSRISIIAKDVPYQILNSTGDVRHIIINIQVW